MHDRPAPAAPVRINLAELLRVCMELPLEVEVVRLGDGRFHVALLIDGPLDSSEAAAKLAAVYRADLAAAADPVF